MMLVEATIIKLIEYINLWNDEYALNMVFRGRHRQHIAWTVGNVLITGIEIAPDRVLCEFDNFDLRGANSIARGATQRLVELLHTSFPIDSTPNASRVYGVMARQAERSLRAMPAFFADYLLDAKTEADFKTHTRERHPEITEDELSSNWRRFCQFVEQQRTTREEQVQQRGMTVNDAVAAWLRKVADVGGDIQKPEIMVPNDSNALVDHVINAMDYVLPVSELLEPIPDNLQQIDQAALTPELVGLLISFDELSEASNHQDRGYVLQDLLVKLLDLYGIPTTGSFTRNEGGEQIDVGFVLDGWHYIVECRWREALADIRQLDGLQGQINRSGKQTMGIFLSVNGWSSNVTKLLKQNPEKSIILMDGNDLRCTLSNNINLKDLIRAKLEKLNLKSEPFYSASTYLKDIESV